MSMNLTIRRITKLVNKIDSALHEVTREATLNTHKNVFIHDSDEIVVTQLNSAASTWSESMNNFVQLHDIRQELRTMVGKANAENGVNDLVTELRAVEAKLGFYTSMRTRTGTDPRLPLSQLSTRLKALRKKGEKAQVEVSAWHRGSETDTNMQSFITLGQSDMDEMRVEEKSLKARIEGITDQLERINASVEVEIPGDLEEQLKKLELVSSVKSL